MFKLWGKLYKNNRLIKDMMVSDPSEETRTHKVYHALDTICLEFDLSHPTWLDSHYREFKQRSRTRFYREHFIEEISFDYLEIQIMEED